jgi:rare lipoprotein A
VRFLFVLFVALGLAACGGGGGHYVASNSGSGTYKVGKPYKINGVWYTPQADPYYDRKGISSWYGRDFHGKRTANGEKYDMNAMTAAHPTLPLPSYVLVTNLENGRQAVLRVNDRGPFAKGRIIDVSRRAAQVLGYEKNGIARVRVQAYPLRSRKAAPPPAIVARNDDTRWLEPNYGQLGRNMSVFVQAGAFSDRYGAEQVKSQLANIGTTTVSSVKVDGRSLYRVRIGPMASVSQADNVLSRVKAMGHAAARVVFECNRNC